MGAERTTVFTDLGRSTLENSKRGNEGYVPIAADHVQLAEAMASHSAGKYVKNAGDANMGSFDEHDDAVNWAVRLMQYYDSARQPSIIVDFDHSLKIGLALSTTESVALGSGDFFGYGVNEGARVQGQAAEGQVLLNDNLFEALGRQWGPEKRDKYVVSIGGRPQKGLDPSETSGGEPGRRCAR